MSALEQRPDAPYIEAALAMLPLVVTENSIRSLQCLVLLSIYFASLLKPCSAHDYAVIASFKAQNILKSRLYADHEENLELLRRAYWAVLLIESELLVQLDLAENGIWRYEAEVSLPSGRKTWRFEPDTSSPTTPATTYPDSILSVGSTSDEMRPRGNTGGSELTAAQATSTCTSSWAGTSSHTTKRTPL
ncbi:hypothetical protein BDW02DRAFT_584746 [Decorospora gaudefroyi]|uniref:Transcription factor domain-containing protein n=1 Tax=Decorospora gaudefroyi TaxID=184978 RepID=A0A6A5K101_9PLEO|nr:hypothetical protein BDW02DRAFT_584746 [Decorospora gaudefroyi]